MKYLKKYESANFDVSVFYEAFAEIIDTKKADVDTDEDSYWQILIPFPSSSISSQFVTTMGGRREIGFYIERSKELYELFSDIDVAIKRIKDSTGIVPIIKEHERKVLDLSLYKLGLRDLEIRFSIK